MFRVLNLVLTLALITTSSGWVQLEEESPKITLQVEGTIPPFLKGTLVRNGPALFEKGDQGVVHPFDGLAMVHAFGIDKGAVTYQNRFIKSTAFKTYQRKKSFDFTGFASDPCRKEFAKTHTHLIPNANVSIAQIADEVVALTETPLPVRLDKNTLETLGLFEFTDSLPKNDCFESAHPHLDPITGDYINYQVIYGKPSYYQVYRVASGSKQRVPIAKIPVESPAYMHSFALTEHYIIFAEFPLILDARAICAGAPFIAAFQWQKERGTRYLVIDRSSGELIKTFIGDPYFAFHHINAYEGHNRIILDLVTFGDAGPIFGKFDRQELRGVNRFTLDFESDKVTMEPLLKDRVELPALHPKKQGQPYRYTYLVNYRMIPDPEEAPALIKLDVANGQVKTWSSRGYQPGEPIFVPKPGGSQEDEGVILTVVLDIEKGHSCLLILDAQTFEEIARAYAPHAIPIGLHGAFI